MNTNAASSYLRDHDPVLGKIIAKINLPKQEKSTDYFAGLVELIINQQLSNKAATTIFNRFKSLFITAAFPMPAEILKMPDEKIRTAGVSFQKISYIKDLSERVDKKLLDLSTFSSVDDENVIVHLTQVKGIGRWTAEMFLMFSLNRPDVFSYGDLGIKNAMQKLYKLKSHPSEKKAQQLSNKWRPYRSYACRYLWASLDFEK